MRNTLRPAIFVTPCRCKRIARACVTRYGCQKNADITPGVSGGLLFPSPHGAMKSIACSDDTLLAFIEHLPWPAVVMDFEGRIIALGGNAQTLGLSESNLGRRLGELMPDYIAALGGEVPWIAPQQCDVTREVATGVLHERLHLRPIPDGFCLIIEDRSAIRARKVADIQTNRLATLGFMIAGVSHEVSNPLTAMRSMIQILLAGERLTPETMRKGLANISSNVQRLMDISRRLVEFSRVGDAPRTALPIDYAISEALSGLLPDARFSGVTVDHQENPAAIVYGHAGQLQEVFTNILINAAQAMNSAGHIRIRSSQSGNNVHIRVEDDGPGIDAAVIEKIFEPFFTTRSTNKGTGLGLAICSEILREHGGAISAHNNNGLGASFQISLPAFRDQ
jgi:signal transduction histidine kinase